MCTESSNQQRMWKDLLGETLRAFLARCTLFLLFFSFCEMGKKVQTSSQLQIWLGAHQRAASVAAKCFLRQTEQKVGRGTQRLTLLNSKK